MNTGLLFTKLYFKSNDINYDREETGQGEFSEKLNFSADHFTNINRQVLSAGLSAKNELNENAKFIEKTKGYDHFELQTVYPGLLLGSGYVHDIKHQDAFKLGFYFDHTTGLPVIPGSSVKGVLRSAFEKANGNYVKELLKSILEEDKKEENNSMTPDEKIEKLWEPAKETGKTLPRIVWHIFEGKGYMEKKGQKVWDYLPMPNRDIFLDAFPVKVKNKLLGNDYITPHKDKDGRYNPLKDPTPIQFLKVMPGVTFRFEFILHDYMDENGNTLITVDNKRALFKAILKDLGIGAKTNVGYGQFKKNASKQSSSISKTIESNTDSITNTESITKKPLEKIKKREELLAKVLKNENGKITVELMVEGYTKPATFTYRAGLQPETLVIVKVNNIQGKGKNRTLQVEFKKLYNP